MPRISPARLRPARSGYGQPGYGQPGPAGWNAAPAPGGIPLRPLALGDILNGSVTLARRNPAATFGLAAIAMTIYGVIVTVVEGLIATRPGHGRDRAQELADADLAAAWPSLRFRRRRAAAAGAGHGSAEHRAQRRANRDAQRRHRPGRAGASRRAWAKRGGLAGSAPSLPRQCCCSCSASPSSCR